MGMRIINPGPMSTFQDRGRFGYMSIGFSPSGAMDPRSLQIANKLVFNNDDEACLEMTYFGIHAQFSTDCVIALTGADMNWTINNEPVDRYCALEAKKDDILSGTAAKKGMRAYLSVAGGFKLDRILNSWSTNVKCAVGGFHGRKLQKEDHIEFRYPREALYHRLCGKITPENMPEKQIVVRVILGPQDDMFTDRGIRDFLTGKFIITGDSDRMGIRLDGCTIESKNGVDIISDGISFGAIQIPSSGKPIIMMADRQTVGGYAKIANVITVDLPLIAQAQPGTEIRFQSVSVQQAQKLLKHDVQCMNRYDMLLNYA